MKIGQRVEIQGEVWVVKRLTASKLVLQRETELAWFEFALWRNLNRLTYRQAAQRLNISPTYACYFETGKRPIPQHIRELIAPSLATV